MAGDEELIGDAEVLVLLRLEEAAEGLSSLGDAAVEPEAVAAVEQVSGLRLISRQQLRIELVGLLVLAAERLGPGQQTAHRGIVGIEIAELEEQLQRLVGLFQVEQADGSPHLIGLLLGLQGQQLVIGRQGLVE